LIEGENAPAQVKVHAFPLGTQSDVLESKQTMCK
jgi:hypothetical protein